MQESEAKAIFFLEFGHLLNLVDHYISALQMRLGNPGLHLDNSGELPTVFNSGFICTLSPTFLGSSQFTPGIKLTYATKQECFRAVVDIANDTVDWRPLIGVNADPSYTTLELAEYIVRSACHLDKNSA